MLLLTCFSHPTQSAPLAHRAISAVNQALPGQRAGLPVIVAFGDSLTAGYGAGPGHSYPDYLQRDLDAAGYHYRIVNLGITGNTTKDALARVHDVLAQRPAVTIVAIGGNDGLRGIPVTDIRANLDAILSMLQRSGTRVLIGGIELPPNYGAQYVQSFNAVYPALAAKYKAPLLPFMLQGVWDKPALMQADGIHPTAPGQEVVAQNFLPVLEPMLKKQR